MCIRDSTGRQALADLLEQQIADVMAERIVEDLEVIEINKQQRAILFTCLLYTSRCV